MKDLFTAIILALALMQAVIAEKLPGIYNYADIGRFLDDVETGGEEIDRRLQEEVNKLASGSKKDKEWLYEIALNSDHPLQEYAIRALGILKNDHAANILVEIVRRKEYIRSSDALKILSELPTEFAAPRLLQLLEDPALNEERGFIISYLRKHPCRDVEIALLQQLNVPEIREYAITVLLAIGTSLSLEALKHYAENDPDPSMRGSAQYALTRIKRRVGETDEKEHSLEEKECALRARLPPEFAMDDDDLEKAVAAAMNGVKRDTQRDEVSPETMEQRRQDRARLAALALELSRIQVQALQAKEVREATSEFYKQISAKALEIDPKIEKFIRNGDLTAVILQPILGKARHDPAVRQTEQKVRIITFEAMKRIDSRTEKLMQEFNDLFERFVQ